MDRVLRSLLVVAAAATVVLTLPPAVGKAIAAAPSAGSVVSITPTSGQVVGIAQPITVRFRAAVTDRAAAEGSVAVSASEPMTGTFSWLNDATLQWNPIDFWPAHSPVSVLAGGAKSDFTTGAAVVGIADISDYTFTVRIDDQVVREMPSSMGKPGFETPLGTFQVLEKQRSVVFDSRTIGIPLDDPEGYLIDGEYGVRVTWGGVYVHSAPWSVGSQGRANVSHGCINLGPENAEWYFNTVRVGDPVIVRS